MLSTESGFSEQVYLVAAQERMTQANLLLGSDIPDYVTASYLAGVAVECLFHAYRMRSGVADTAKHNLAIHANISGFYDRMSSRERQRISEYLSEVVARWQNNHRYRSADALRGFVVKWRLFTVKGQSTTRQDALQYNAEVLVEAAGQIVTAGVRRWTS